MRKLLTITLSFVIVIALLATLVLHKPEPGLALENAAGNGDLSRVKSLIMEGAPINYIYPTFGGWTPLMAAIFHGNDDVAQYLVELGADVNLPDVNGNTPLMILTGFRDQSVPMVKFLLAHGANLYLKNKYGQTVFDDALAYPPAPKLLETLEVAEADQKNLQRTRSGEVLSTRPMTMP